MSSHYVVHGESVRIAKGQIDVGLSGKVEDGVDVMFAYYIQDSVGIGYVSNLQAEVGKLADTGNIILCRTIVHLVKDNDIILWVRNCEVTGNVGSDETSTACNHYSFDIGQSGKLCGACEYFGISG